MTTKQTPGRPGFDRPLSPFMIGPYYRPQLTSMMSITHRAAGVGLTFGFLLLAGWLIAIANGPEAYAAAMKHVGAWYGQVVLLGFSWAILYHLCNGIRHLGWDFGWGLNIKTAYRTGYTVIASSIVLTAAVWAVAHLH